MSVRSLRRRLIRAVGPTAQRLSHATGLMRLCNGPRPPRGALVLMYHSVADHPAATWLDPQYHVPARVFERQMEFLASRRRVVSLDRLVETVSAGHDPDPGTVVITFDDGYLDVPQVAAPIIARLDLCATVFIPTGYVDSGQTQWVDQVYTAFSHRTVHELAWGLHDERVYPLVSAARTRECYEMVCAEFQALAMADRPARIAELYDRLRPSCDPPPRLTMNWDEIRLLRERYPCFQIGAHTVGHTDLAELSQNDANVELRQCTARIRSELGMEPRHFASCYGRCTPSLRDVLKHMQYAAVFGDCGFDPVITAETDLLCLPRVAAPRSFRDFPAATSVSNRGMWRRLGQR